VPLLADRDLSARGVEVKFFGRTTKMPPGPAILALRTGAPLFVVTCWFEPDRPVGSMSHPIELADKSGSFGDRVRRLTQLVATEFERGIREHPTDWHMLGKMFIDEPPGAPVARSAEVPSHPARADATRADAARADAAWADAAPADTASADCSAGGYGARRAGNGLRSRCGSGSSRRTRSTRPAASRITYTTWPIR